MLKPKPLESKKVNVRGKSKQQVNKILTRHGFGNDKTSKSRGRNQLN